MTAVDKIRGVLVANNLTAVALSTRRNFAWLTRGGTSAVDAQTERGVATFVVTADQVILVASKVEVDRLVAEQLNGLPADRVTFEWFEDADAIVNSTLQNSGATTHLDVGSDDGRFGKDVSHLLARTRSVLEPTEMDSYRSFGAEASACIERVLLRSRPGMTEQAVAVDTYDELMRSQIYPDVIQVGSDSRLSSYPHAMPTSKAVERHLRVAICGQKHGLVVSTTRAVNFGKAPQALEAEYRSAGHVLAEATAATTPGRTYADLWQIILRAYGQCGYPDGWRTQHQGGPTGYAPREWLLIPESDETVKAGQAFAWNPVFAGAKAEATFLVGAEGPEVISATGEWPLIEVTTEAGTFASPDLRQMT